MLLDLVEVETGSAIADAVRRLEHPAFAAGEQVFADLGYMFWGRSATLSPMWIAGGVTTTGISVTGSGLMLQEAIWGVLGETAEASCRFGAAPRQRPERAADLDAGYGAHTDLALAQRHARHEVIERRVVDRWWAGEADAWLLSPEVVDDTLSALGISHPDDRTVVMIEIAAPEGLKVLLAAGFAASGGDFCFGAACRTTTDLARLDALRELAQAEFALGLARMKKHRFGPGALRPGDHVNLRLAEAVTLARLKETGLIGPTDQPRSTSAETQISMHTLGRYAEVFHVVEAALSPVMLRPRIEDSQGAVFLYASPA